jgi:hypothetical protein
MSFLRPLLGALLLAAGLSLAGCYEAEERWVFDQEGGGHYHLQVRWRADLWRRAERSLGKATAARLMGPPLPLAAGPWEDSLAGVPGITLEEASRGEAPGGWRTFTLRFAFRKASDLKGVTLMRGRKIELGPTPTDPARCRLRMSVVPFLPVLDAVASLLSLEATAGAVLARGLDEREKARDPPPRGRLGLDGEQVALFWKGIRLAVRSARVAVRVEAHGRFLDLPADAERLEEGGVRLLLVDPARGGAAPRRDIDLEWALGALDKPPQHRQPGAFVRPTLWR